MDGGLVAYLCLARLFHIRILVRGCVECLDGVVVVMDWLRYSRMAYDHDLKSLDVVLFMPISSRRDSGARDMQSP